MLAAKKWGVTLAATTVLGFAPAVLSAQRVVVGAELSGGQERPMAVNTTGRGFGSILFDQATDQLTIRLSVQGLTSNTMAVGPGGSSAHVHVITMPNGNGPIAVPLVSAATLTAPADLIGVTDFNYNETFTFAQIGALAGLNLGALSSFRTQLVNAIGQPEGTTLQAYFNVHTMAFMGGEIRGDLAVVPEPSTYVLLATGVGVLGLVARRRQRTMV